VAERIARPGSRLQRLLAETTPYDISLAVITAVVAIPAALRYFNDGNPAVGCLLVACAAVTLILSVTKAVVVWRAKAAKQSPHLLECSLHALYEILLLAEEGESEYQHGLRLTVHVPVSGRDELQQVLDYIGDGRDGKRKAGRRFPASSGIIGRALREKEGFAASRKNDNYTAYINELISEWGYSKDQAEALHPGTMAWMAIPLVDQATNTVEGIVYLDSTDPEFFTDIRQTLAICACAGIAKYVTQA
jgi:hypothetical protein